MIIIGLTGSIGMGKTFVASCFEDENIGVFDADKEIHIMMQDGGEATPKVAEIFPDVVASDGSIDRAKLGAIVFAEPPKLLKLEKILHPMVQEKGEAFANQQLDSGAKMMVQDIPLLYETGADKECHVVIVVSAPLDVQQQRVMQRENMTDEKYQQILKLQLLQKEKEQRADFVINTDCEKEQVREQVKDVIAKITQNY